MSSSKVFFFLLSFYPELEEKHGWLHSVQFESTTKLKELGKTGPDFFYCIDLLSSSHPWKTDRNQIDHCNILDRTFLKMQKKM